MTDYERRLRDYGLTDSQLVEVKVDIDNAITTAVEQKRERIEERVHAAVRRELDRIARRFDDLSSEWAATIRSLASEEADDE